jgi:ubiquinone/menaquinone biosynthesis C-methylase UbiE
MPAENIWPDFFNVDLILSELLVNSKIIYLVEIGCGYGTFTIPSAKLIAGKLFAFDIEEEMLGIVKRKLKNEHIENVILEQKDILTQTTGLAENSIDYVMLFNILHCESPVEFLNEAYRILKPKGKVGIMHWRSDIITPRGPELKIRPKPDQILQWIDEQKFSLLKKPVVLEPYLFGLILSKI